MKLSKILHVASVVVGLTGIVSFLVAVLGNSESFFGITKMDTLACAALLMLIAIWTAISTLHHMKLEEKGEVF